MSTKDIIDSLFNGDAADFRTQIKAELNARAEVAVEQYKRDLGEVMFSTEEAEDLDEFAQRTVGPVLRGVSRINRSGKPSKPGKILAQPRITGEKKPDPNAPKRKGLYWKANEEVEEVDEIAQRTVGPVLRGVSRINRSGKPSKPGKILAQPRLTGEKKPDPNAPKRKGVYWKANEEVEDLDEIEVATRYQQKQKKDSIDRKRESLKNKKKGPVFGVDYGGPKPYVG